MKLIALRFVTVLMRVPEVVWLLLALLAGAATIFDWRQ
ncbi:MAG: hypothetical protein RL291_993 [Pseudomonadota bacterium]